MKIRLSPQIASAHPGVHWTFGFTPHGKVFEAVEVFFACFLSEGYPPSLRVFALIEEPRNPLHGYFACVPTWAFEIVNEQNPAPKSN